MLNHVKRFCLWASVMWTRPLLRIERRLGRTPLTHWMIHTPLNASARWAGMKMSEGGKRGWVRLGNHIVNIRVSD